MGEHHAQELGHHSAHAADFEWFEIDLDASAVEGRVRAVHPDERRKALHGGVLQDRRGQRGLALVGRKRGDTRLRITVKSAGAADLKSHHRLEGIARALPGDVIRNLPAISAM